METNLDFGNQNQNTNGNPFPTTETKHSKFEITHHMIINTQIKTRREDDTKKVYFGSENRIFVKLIQQLSPAF